MMQYIARLGISLILMSGKGPDCLDMTIAAVYLDIKK